MSQGDGAAVQIHLVHVDAEFTDAVEGLGSKGLVDFKNTDITQLQPGQFKQLGNSHQGPHAHLIGLTAGRGVADKFCQGLQIEFLDCFLTGQDGCRCTVRHLGRVAGGNRAAGGKGRSELG